MTVVGMMAAGALGRKVGRGGETIGGIVLIAIGVWIVVNHLGP